MSPRPEEPDVQPTSRAAPRYRRRVGTGSERPDGIFRPLRLDPSAASGAREAVSDAPQPKVWRPDLEERRFLEALSRWL